MKDKRFKVVEDTENKVVSICYCTKDCDYMEDFMSIWIDDDKQGVSSPFENIRDAGHFAEIIVKLLSAIL